MENENNPPRVISIDKVYEEVNFKQWKEKIEHSFPDLAFAAEVALSILAQILITDITNPFALVLVDVPSSGKTITLNFFAGIEGLTYASDKFTPASFVSGAANVSKENLKDVDLLPRLRNKMFIIRDLATVFSKGEDELKGSLGILTRALDGEGLVIETGTHGSRGYSGEFLFMMLAASTPIPPRVWKMMGHMGARLFFLKINSKEKSDHELTEQLTYKSYKEKEKECKEITKNLLYTLWSKYPEGIEWNRINESQQARLFIARTAKLLARLRAPVDIWKEPGSDGIKFEHTIPLIEQPDRINQLFYNLARGHALAAGRTQLADEDLKIIIELAIDSAPVIRAELFRKLIDNEGRMKTSAVMKNLNCSRPTALKEMETLKILRLCYIDKHDDEYTLRLTGEFEWLLEEYCLRVRGISHDVPLDFRMDSP